MYTLVFPYFVHVGRTHFLGISTSFVAMFNVLLNVSLISYLGAVGAAQATLFSWLLMFLSAWIYSTRLCKMPWARFLKAES